jgi:alpha-glucosidase
VLTNFGPVPVELPAGVTVLLASEPLTGDGRVPQDVTIWAR